MPAGQEIRQILPGSRCQWVVLAVAVTLAVRFDPGRPLPVRRGTDWIPSFGTGYILGIDGIAPGAGGADRRAGAAAADRGLARCTQR